MDVRRPKDVEPELLRAHLTATREYGDTSDTSGRFETLWTRPEHDEDGATDEAHEVWNGHLVHSTFKRTKDGVETLRVTAHPLRRVEQITFQKDEGVAVLVVGGRVQYVPLLIGQRILAYGQ